MKSPAISIITPCLNGATYIGQTIESIQRQTHTDLEHIVVDGGSTDGTLDLLEQHRSHLTLVSAPHLNQAAAINEGMRRASGSILAWLNADDLYAPDALSRISRFYCENRDAKFVYGNALAIDASSRVFGSRHHVRAATFDSLVIEGDFVVQPAAFWTRECWNIAGPLREDLEWTLDYDFWIRVARRFSLEYLPETLALERLHGDAKTVRGGVARFDEMKQMIARHGGVGLPTAFRPEACATYLQAGLGALLRLRTRDASLLLREAMTNFRKPLKVLAYVGVQLLFGTGGVARARLWANRVRDRA